MSDRPLGERIDALFDKPLENWDADDVLELDAIKLEIEQKDERIAKLEREREGEL